MSKKGIEFEALITSEIPQRAFELSDDKKAEVLISLMKDLRTNINEWTERTYKAAIWSIGLMLAIVGFTFSNQMTSSLYVQIIIILGILIIGVLTQIYLWHGLKAHSGTGVALEKCQASLGLCEENYYLKGKAFFGFSGNWIKAKSIRILQLFHLLVMLVLITITILFR